MATTKTRALDLSKSADRAFAHLLVNTLLVSVINFTVWFAVTFWVFLETRSVLATGMVAGIFLVTTALSGMIGGWFGTGPDRGIALVFVLTGLLGLVVTLLALRSRPYRQLSERYTGEPELAPAEAQ
jgi:MFS transporter, DHA3 family, multidrug efflux protein